MDDSSTVAEGRRQLSRHWTAGTILESDSDRVTDMDQRLEAIEFQNCLHGFLKGRGTGTAAMEAKLAQQLAFLK